MTAKGSDFHAAAHDAFRSGLKLGAFIAAGLPAFMIAVPLNWLLVRKLLWIEPVAYGLVLVCQVVMNFFVCRWLVFRKRSTMPLVRQFARFATGILLFRLADWSLYTVLVSVFGLHFISVQMANICIFAVLKFRFSRKIMEG